MSRNSELTRLRKIYNVKIHHDSKSNEFVESLKVLAGLYDKNEKEPHKLTDFSKTTQILLKYTLQCQEIDGSQSKTFFRLRRFVFRGLQRTHGFEDDIKEYDEFVKDNELLYIKGNYIYTKVSRRTTDLTKERTAKDSTFDKSFQANPSKPTAYQRNITRSPEGVNRRRLEDFKRHIEHYKTSRSPIMDSYLGSTVKDLYLMKGMYMMLMIYSTRINRIYFNEIWNLLGMINMTDYEPMDYWLSPYGQLRIAESWQGELRPGDIYNHGMVGPSVSSFYDPRPRQTDTATIIGTVVDETSRYYKPGTENVIKCLASSLELKHYVENVPKMVTKGTNRSRLTLIEEFVFRDYLIASHTTSPHNFHGWVNASSIQPQCPF